MSRASLNGRTGRLSSGVAACLWALTALQCARPASREIEAFQEAFARIDFNYTEASQDQAKSAARALDDVVVALLNNKNSPESIGQILASLAGSDVSTGAERAEANAFAKWPEYTLAYTLFPIGDAAKIFAAVYVFDGGGWVVGHLSVFTQSGDRWGRADALDASNRLHAYPVDGSSVPTLAVIDHYPAADGWLGGLQVWSVNDGKLTKRGERYEPLRFYELHRAGDGLRVAYSDFAKCLGVSVSQLGLSTFELWVRAIDGVPQVQTRTTAPWVVAVDDACAAVHAGGSPAIEASVSQAVGLRALRPEHVILWEAKGDGAAGTGSVTVTTDAEKFFHFDVRRRPDGSWRIEKVSEGPAG